MLQILKWGAGGGAVGVLVGFVGPILLTPDANQGPLLGIFITGPAGFLGGCLYGALRAARDGDRLE